MKIYIYIILMSVTTYLLRVLPLTLIRGRIKSRFVSSFLYYIPCACLAAMTFPAILSATDSIISGTVGFAVAFLLAYFERSLVVVAASSCAAVFICERLIEVLPRIIGG